MILNTFVTSALYFNNNELTINTWSYLRSVNYADITNKLEINLKVEETSIQGIKETLNNFDEQVLQRLWEIKRQGKF